MLHTVIDGAVHIINKRMPWEPTRGTFQTLHILKNLKCLLMLETQPTRVGKDTTHRDSTFLVENLPDLGMGPGVVHCKPHLMVAIRKTLTN